MRHLPEGTVYINVDQGNMPARLLSAVKALPGGRVAAFVHDTIPLDHPEVSTHKSRVKFERLLHRVRQHADVILTNSHVSARDIERHLSAWGPVGRIHVAHLGVEPDFFQNEDNREAPPFTNPFFLMVGTIEPRKNHKLILDVWDQLSREIAPEKTPHLVICGRRGWLNEEVFDRLNSSPLRGTYLHEFNNISDAEIRTYLNHCTAALFPSIVEGFGLPPVEAAAAGAPVICSDLEVFHETLGDIPIYASVTDSYAWKNAIIDLTQQAQGKGIADRDGGYTPPSWEAHFNTVLKMV
ncbi:glycosyltransferase family 1 protein [uncultured Shimia sp.]|uniref:glycosyltransferase family 4 protein n=1 Tax=uncultured Shimia sp. TaxID=573152 RepID=UPI002615ABBC|nr:glycosyltransferase family 1 protein [uncultured Shimia sp.]